MFQVHKYLTGDKYPLSPYVPPGLRARRAAGMSKILEGQVYFIVGILIL